MTQHGGPPPVLLNDKENAVKPSTERILLHLRRNRHRYVPSTELMDLPCIDFRKRISELRREGCVIASRRVQGKPYSEYNLVMEAQ